MANPIAQRAPASDNYCSEELFLIINPFSGRIESLRAEDWRAGWKKEGELVGDKKPVIRVLHPDDSFHFALVRPYFVHRLDGSPILRNGRPLITVRSPLLTLEHTTLPTQTEDISVRLIEVFQAAFGPPVECKESKYG